MKQEPRRDVGREEVRGTDTRLSTPTTTDSPRSIPHSSPASRENKERPVAVRSIDVRRRESESIIPAAKPEMQVREEDRRVDNKEYRELEIKWLSLSTSEKARIEQEKTRNWASTYKGLRI